MHPQSTLQDLSVQERAALLAVLPTAGRERSALAPAGVIYARVSTDGQDSIPAQLDAGRAYAARNGIPVGYELEDTGSGLSAARAAYQRLLALA
jgi:predicted site-specific integrase-resolvase